MEKEGYLEENIVVMMDDAADPAMQPSRENIVSLSLVPSFHSSSLS